MNSLQKVEWERPGVGQCGPLPANLDSLVSLLAAQRLRTEAEAHTKRGAARYAEGDPWGSVSEFDEALRLDPGLVAAYNNRGVARHELGDATGALADFDEALRLGMNSSDLYGNRAAVRAELGDQEGAEEDCHRALALAPLSATAHARRGVLRQKQKDWSAALADYARALQLNPRLYWVYVLRGNTRYHTGDWHGLCEDYERAFALQPERAAALVVRALFAEPEFDPDEALGGCDEHLRQDGGDATSYARRGLILLWLQRDEEAETNFARSRALCPPAAPYLNLLIDEAKKRRPQTAAGDRDADPTLTSASMEDCC